MSQQDLDIVRRGWEHFLATGEPLAEIYAADFVWDMTAFGEVIDLEPEYVGVDGVRRFMEGWTAPFEEWEIEVLSYHDAGDAVVTICRQRARSAGSGVPVEMLFAQVWTVRDGRQARMVMYSDPAAAMRVVGLGE